jgi:Domain of unknown function (DUF5615)
MALLGREGHDVVSARDLSSERLPDDAQLLATVRSDRVFVTHNRADFKLLHDAWLTWPAAFGLALPSHPGILVLDSAPPATLAQVLTTFLAGLPPERLANSYPWACGPSPRMKMVGLTASNGRGRPTQAAGTVIFRRVSSGGIVMTGGVSQSLGPAGNRTSRSANPGRSRHDAV